MEAVGQTPDGPPIQEEYAFDGSGRLQPFSPPNGVIGSDIVRSAAEASEIIIRQTTVELEKMVREMREKEKRDGGEGDGHPSASAAEEGFGEEGGENDRAAFIRSEGLTSSEAALLMAKYGRNELAEKHTPKWLVFLSQLYQPMPVMIW